MSLSIHAPGDTAEKSSFPSKDHQASPQDPSSIAVFYGYLRSTGTGMVHVAYNLYLITIDDTPTFVVPNTVFGISAAMTSSLITSTGHFNTMRSLKWTEFILTILRTVLFNWSNLLIFDLANQRQADGEDTLNKPWRPIPSRRMTATQMRHWLLVALPTVVAYNFFLRVGTESCMLSTLTWIYNDLGGGDDNWLVRNLIIACAFGVYNLGSMRVALSSAAPFSPEFRPIGPTSTQVSSLGYVWVIMISGVIFTTMHIQDLRDTAGDQARGRRSAPIVLGRRITVWTISIPVLAWSTVCVWFWGTSFITGGFTLCLGLVVVWRCLNMSGKAADRRTWQIWCGWTAALYILPPLSQ